MKSLSAKFTNFTMIFFIIPPKCFQAPEGKEYYNLCHKI